jgi:hypothetical protein
MLRPFQMRDPHPPQPRYEAGIAVTLMPHSNESSPEPVTANELTYRASKVFRMPGEFGFVLQGIGKLPIPLTVTWMLPFP